MHKPQAAELKCWLCTHVALLTPITRCGCLLCCQHFAQRRRSKHAETWDNTVEVVGGSTINFNVIDQGADGNPHRVQFRVSSSSQNWYCKHCFSVLHLDGCRLSVVRSIIIVDLTWLGFRCWLCPFAGLAWEGYVPQAPHHMWLFNNTCTRPTSA